MSHPNFDILWAIFNLRNDIDIEIDWDEVKAHQDDADIGQELTCLETLNCKVDCGAKEFLRYIRQTNQPAVKTLYGWRLSLNRDSIYTNLKRNIYGVCHGESLHEHIQNQKGYDMTTF